MTARQLRKFYSTPAASLALLEELCAQRGSRTLKGDKRPREHVERQKASRRANVARKRAAEEAARLAANPPPAPATMLRILEAFEDGAWRARLDVIAKSGIVKSSVDPITLKAWRTGWLERVQNPDWRPLAYRKGEPAHEQLKRHGAQPQWLYRLTRSGVERLRQLRRENATCGGESAS